MRFWRLDLSVLVAEKDSEMNNDMVQGMLLTVIAFCVVIMIVIATVSIYWNAINDRVDKYGCEAVFETNQ